MPTPTGPPRPKPTLAAILWVLATLTVPALSHKQRESPKSGLDELLNLGGSSCWGHEKGCSFEDAHGVDGIKCSDDIDVYSGKESRRIFHEQADFGYLAGIRETEQVICQGEESTLMCTKNLQFCHGSNIVLDMRGVHGQERSLRYQTDVLQPGNVGGRCEVFRRDILEDNFEHMSALQSWAPEMRNFASLNESFEDMCDVYVEEPTYVMKLDAVVNLYHHFCDFLNLYLSQHLLSSLDDEGNEDTFDLKKRILIWENDPYNSNFGAAFRAFTDRPLANLDAFGPARICFRRLVFSLPPRMFFGLYYNTPLIPNCSNSSLINSFSKFMLRQMGIVRRTKVDSSLLRVTLLSRETPHRRILNQNQLVAALEATGRYQVTLARFSHATDFLQQVQTVHDSDILVGMHGAGLTHLLFLPEWGSVFEVYDCADPGCYGDLARLRGVGYVGWTESEGPLAPRPERDPKLADPKTAHEKFTNYEFDPEEFVRKVDEARDKVISHPSFRTFLHQSGEKEEL